MFSTISGEESSPIVSVEVRGGIQAVAASMTTGAILNSALSSIPFVTIFDAAPLRIRSQNFYVRMIGQSNAYPAWYLCFPQIFF